MQRYFDEPYRFVPPYRGTLWCRLAQWFLPHQLRRKMGVYRRQYRGADHLRASLAQGAGILLAANHSRWPDPAVLGLLSFEVGRFFYFMASYHLFRQQRSTGRWLNRLGGFSVLREGTDRESLRASVRIVAEAERPLALFPEGTWFRQNDRLGPLQEGTALIARQAACATTRPVVLHPVAIKYWALRDPRPILTQRLDSLETRLGWHAQKELALVPRVEKLGNALLSLKEVEHFGSAQPGTLDERIGRLAESHVAGLEKFFWGKVHNGLLLERIRRLRQLLVRRLREPDADKARAAQRGLDDLLFCENLAAHSMAYLHEDPSWERLTEAVQRIEETVFDTVDEALVPHGAVVEVGPALDVRQFARDRSGASAGDPLLVRLAFDLQGMLDRLRAQGPPPEWDCPLPAAYEVAAAR